jgi:hypothetical protein
MDGTQWGLLHEQGGSYARETKTETLLGPTDRNASALRANVGFMRVFGDFAENQRKQLLRNREI